MYIPERFFALGQVDPFPPGIEDPDGPFCWLGYMYGGARSRWYCVGKRLADSYRDRLRTLAAFIRGSDPYIFGPTETAQENWVQAKLISIWSNVKMWLDRYARDWIENKLWGTVSDLVMTAKREGEAEVLKAWREKHPNRPPLPPPIGGNPPPPTPVPGPGDTARESLLDRIASAIRDALQIPAEIATIKTVLVIGTIALAVYIAHQIASASPPPRSLPRARRA